MFSDMKPDKTAGHNSTNKSLIRVVLLGINNVIMVIVRAMFDSLNYRGPQMRMTLWGKTNKTKNTRETASANIKKSLSLNKLSGFI